MPAIFVDTGAWIAMLLTQDARHQQAMNEFRGLTSGTRLVTTNFVVAEAVTWFIYHGYRAAAFRMRAQIEAAEQQELLRLIRIEKEEEDDAWSYLEQFQDQRFSFQDCTSFAVAVRSNVDYVFGFDRDFQIAGFDLRPGPS